ncbi:hypothetical protein GOV13_03420 [Candidatus Pacearchaeota archaeon]|nr:hypothetical protein [Candidatus Pacearchaeota archaeon]
MEVELFDKAKPYNGFSQFLQIGIYQISGEEHPIYISRTFPKKGIAWISQNGTICIDLEAYEALKETPKFKTYLETICKHEVELGYLHEHTSERPDTEKEVLDYLRKKGFDCEY